MAPPQPAPTLGLYESTNQRRLQDYYNALENGTYRAFIYPWDSISAVCLLLALLVFPRLPDRVVRNLRFPTFVLILGHCAYVGRTCRTIGFAGGYGIGLAAMWGCIMTVALLLIKDLKTDFQRLEARVADLRGQKAVEANGSAIAKGSMGFNGSDGEMRRRKDVPSTESFSEMKRKDGEEFKLSWQGLPSTFWHSLDWSVDLMTSFRGINWNFRNLNLGPLSPTITKHPHPSSSPALRQIQLTALRDFLLYYLLLDLAKSIGVQDPYFLGLAPLSSPSPYHLLHPYPTLTRILRLLLAMSATHITLAFIFTLSPLIFPLLPQQLTRTPLHHPAMYPPFFSPLFPTIARSGLAGFWGKCWHQMFRFGISQPGIYLTKRLQLPPVSEAARAVQMLTAFFLSGCIHASASYTSFPPNGNVSRPISGPLAFFLLQAIGILVQSWIARAMNSKSFPGMVRRVGNALFAVVWLYFTGPLLADDFARCGVWLFEPIPISFVRGLRGEGWWKWGGQWAGLSQREEWWLKGLAIY